MSFEHVSVWCVNSARSDVVRSVCHTSSLSLTAASSMVRSVRKMPRYGTVPWALDCRTKADIFTRLSAFRSALSGRVYSLEGSSLTVCLRLLILVSTLADLEVPSCATQRRIKTRGYVWYVFDSVWSGGVDYISSADANHSSFGLN